MLVCITVFCVPGLLLRLLCVRALCWYVSMFFVFLACYYNYFVLELCAGMYQCFVVFLACYYDYFVLELCAGMYQCFQCSWLVITITLCWGSVLVCINVFSVPGLLLRLLCVGALCWNVSMFLVFLACYYNYFVLELCAGMYQCFLCFWLVITITLCWGSVLVCISVLFVPSLLLRLLCVGALCWYVSVFFVFLACYYDYFVLGLCAGMYQCSSCS